MEVQKELLAAVAKLDRDVENLRRDVVRLRGRIEPFKDAPKIPNLPSDFDTPKHWSGAEVLGVLDKCRRSILACEYDFNSIRGKLDAIENDSHLRDDLKPWIKG